MAILVRRLQRDDPPAPQEPAEPARALPKLLDIKLRLMMIAALLGAAMAADARDYGQYTNSDPEIKDWVQKLTDKTGQGCCATADGHPAEYEWDAGGKAYKVRIEGEWYAVPPEAVVDGPNKLGYATVWYWWDWNTDGKKTHHIRCFLPGPGG